MAPEGVEAGDGGEQHATTSLGSGRFYRPPARARNPLGRLGVATVVVALIGLLVASAPFASATPTGKASTTVAAPFGGYPAVAVTWAGYGCGFKESVPKAPTFDITTGIARGRGSDSIASCGSLNDTIIVLVESAVADATTFTTTTGPHHIVIRSTFTYTVDLTATPGGAGQSALAYVLIGVGASVGIVGSTTGYNLSTSTFANATVRGTFSGTFTDSATLSGTLNLTAGVTYGVNFGFELYILSQVSPGASSASASVNMATLGDHGKLISISEP